MEFVILALAVAVAFLPMLLMLGVTLLYRSWAKREGRRSPLSEKLLHGPGEQLRKEMEKCDDDFGGAFIAMTIVGPLLLCVWALQRLDWARVDIGTGDWILTLFYVAVVGVAIYKVTTLMARRRRLREGLLAELMTAQLLVPLVSKNCQVFHDIPADGFNLDHVVVGSHAVYLIETKSRKKPAAKGKKSATVEYDGKTLRFPDHLTSRPLDQARHEARWLANFLRGAAGEYVPVIPVVALPGWFVVLGKEAHHSDVLVINPKVHGPFIDSHGRSALSDSLRTRVTYALAQRYPGTDGA